MPKFPITRFILPALAVSVLLLAPFLIAYNHIGARAIFNVFAGDSMYYMGIANNVVKLGIPTMDGGPTNGFHPLWLWVLALLFKLTAASHHNQLFVAFYACLFLVYAAYLLAAFALVKLLGTWPGLLATLMLFPGAYALCFEPHRHYFGEVGTLYTVSPISAVNGMETPISLALWGLLFFLLVRRGLHLMRHPEEMRDITSLFPFSTCLCLGALTLARLDDGFLLAALGLFILLQSNLTLVSRLKALVRIFWPAVYILAVYVIYNLRTVGVALPVSGTGKLSYNGIEAWHSLQNTLLVRTVDVWWWFDSIRVFPTYFSLLAGLACLIAGWRHRNVRQDISAHSLKCLLVIFGFFLLFKGVFYFYFIPRYLQGYWYYFSIVACANVILAIATASFIGKHRAIPVAITFYLALLVFHVPNDIGAILASGDTRLSFNFDHQQSDPKYNQNYADISFDMWNEGDAIRNFLHDKAPHATLIDSQDGMYAYLLDMPAQVFTGLASSPAELVRRDHKGMWVSLLSGGEALVPAYGYLNPNSIHELKVIELLKPPMSPVDFYRVELAH